MLLLNMKHVIRNSILILRIEIMRYDDYIWIEPVIS